MSRRLGRGGGTTVPGVVLLKLRAEGTADLAAELGHGAVHISATNGKTTTTRLISSGLRAANRPVVSNTAGANLLTGVTSALLATTAAERAGSVGLFEVDEAALPAVAKHAPPRVLTLMNLFRDQLDRYGELETLVEIWREMIAALPAQTVLVLNADDPAIASLGEGRENVIWFGVNAHSAALDELSHAADSVRCRTCTTPLHYEQVTLGHLGHWTCPTGDTVRPSLDVAVTNISTDGLDDQTLTLTTPIGDVTTTLSLPGVHNAYNAAAAAATLVALGVDPDHIETGLAATDAAFGRAERIAIDGRNVVLMLAKNPTGANTNIRTALTHKTPLHVLVMLNDRTADGQDVSWIWDVDYEPLLPRLARLTVSGDRAWDMALRFRYAGVDPAVMHVHPDPATALDGAIDATPPGETLFVLPTYTAMLDLRAVLTDRGLTTAFWEEQ